MILNETLQNGDFDVYIADVSDSHKTVYELLSSQLQRLVSASKREKKLHTVGRLYCAASGLLHFTANGFFDSRKLTSPESKIEKTYVATLKKRGNESFIQKAAQGLILPAEKKPGTKMLACNFVSVGRKFY